MISMINVLHLCESSDTGGAESILINIVENLDKTRFTSMVCLLSEGWLKTQLDARHIETVVIPQPHSLDLLWLFRLYRLIKERKIDVIHSHEFATNVYASFISKMVGVPVIATVHGKNYYADKWRRRLAYRFVACKSFMVAVSADLKRFLSERVGIPLRHIRVVHNGIDLHRYKSKESIYHVRKELRIGAEQPVIGTVGNLFAVKGQIYLLKACKIVAGTFPNFVLVVAGDGEQSSFLEKEATSYGIADNVKFLGFRNDIPSILDAIDVFVLPSLSEGLPLSVLEALALQKPVVATNVGGIPEIIEDGITGYLVPPRNPEALATKIVHLLRHPEVAINMGRVGRLRVDECFSLEKMIEKYQSLYEISRQNRRAKI